MRMPRARSQRPPVGLPHQPPSRTRFACDSLHPKRAQDPPSVSRHGRQEPDARELPRLAWEAIRPRSPMRARRWPRWRRTRSLWQAGTGPKGVSGSVVYERFRRYLSAAGLKPTGLHVLRHSASRLRRDACESVERGQRVPRPLVAGCHNDVPAAARGRRGPTPGSGWRGPSGCEVQRCQALVRGRLATQRRRPRSDADDLERSECPSPALGRDERELGFLTGQQSPDRVGGLADDEAVDVHHLRDDHEVPGTAIGRLDHHPLADTGGQDGIHPPVERLALADEAPAQARIIQPRGLGGLERTPAGSHVGALQEFFGTDEIAYQITNPDIPEPRSYGWMCSGWMRGLGAYGGIASRGPACDPMPSPSSHVRDFTGAPRRLRGGLRWPEHSGPPPRGPPAATPATASSIADPRGSHAEVLIVRLSADSGTRFLGGCVRADGSRCRAGDRIAQERRAIGARHLHQRHRPWPTCTSSAAVKPTSSGRGQHKQGDTECPKSCPAN
jgi:hypothetical protein